VSTGCWCENLISKSQLENIRFTEPERKLGKDKDKDGFQTAPFIVIFDVERTKGSVSEQERSDVHINSSKLERSQYVTITAVSFHRYTIGIIW